MANKGRPIPASASEKVVVFTVSPPFKKGSPGYVSMEAKYDGDVQFTGDIWRALAEDRQTIDRLLPGMRARTKSALFTHTAIAMLYDPEFMA